MDGAKEIFVSIMLNKITHKMMIQTLSAGKPPR